MERCLRRAVEARDLDGALSIAVADDAQRHGVAGLTIATIATLARIARRRIGKTFWKDEWFLAARPVNTHRPGRFRRLPQAENGYRADPFLFEHAGRSYVFFEEFDYGRGLGHLSVGVLDATGELGEIVPCLVPDFHVSYPGVFEHDGKIYMLPETVSRKTITLYEAVEFPTSWRIARELVGGVDITEIKRGALRRMFGMVLQDTWRRAVPVVGRVAGRRLDISPCESGRLGRSLRTAGRNALQARERPDSPSPGWLTGLRLRDDLASHHDDDARRVCGGDRRCDRRDVAFERTPDSYVQQQ